VHPLADARHERLEVVVDKGPLQFAQQRRVVLPHEDAGTAARGQRVALEDRHERTPQRHAEERLVLGVPHEHVVEGRQRHPAGAGVADQGRQGQPVRVALPGKGGRHVRLRLPALLGGGEEVRQAVAADEVAGRDPTGGIVDDESWRQSADRLLAVPGREVT
jgi:hypothetical protein